MSSDTPPNGNAMDSNTSRFSLDGIVAEMVIEVDEENNSLPSPSKLFKVNGLDDHEKLKSSDSTKCSATLDLEIIEEISTNIENPQSKETVCKSSEASESKDKVQESEILIKAEIKLENVNEKYHNLSENIINELVEIKKELVDESDMTVVSENKEKVTESEKNESLESATNEEKASEIDTSKTERSEIRLRERKTRDIKSGSNENVTSKSKKTSNATNKKKRTFQPKDNNDDEDESKDEPRTRRLRSNTVEKGKEEPVKTKNITKKKAEVLGKRKPEISKSTPVSNKKRKISKDEDLKKEKKNTKVTGKRLRSAVQSSPNVQKSVKVTRTSLKQTEAKPETKRLSLRKATLLKTANAAAAAASASATASTSAVASTYISTEKSKVYILNCGENKNLSVFSEIKENVDKSDMKFLRYLYRILYDQWPPKEIDELKREILNFCGYNFKKKSQDLEKREQVLKKMPDSSVIEICKILDLKQGTKENMISDIIKFLLKPTKIVISTVDPLDPSMQPVVRLQRISISTNNTSKAITKTEVKPPVKISKRVRIPSVKLDIYDTDIKSKLFLPEKVPTKHKIEKRKSQSGIGNKSNTKRIKGEISNKTEINLKVTTQKSSTVVKKSSTVAASAKKKLKSKSSRKKVSASQNAGQKTSKLAIKSQKAKLPPQTSSEEKHTETLEEKIPEELEQNEIAETVSKKIIESADKTAIKENSSDATVSSDEAKYQSKIDSPRKRQKRVGKPLRYFTRIKENILKANFSELQRLHILLFGASDKVKKSDKADNLKGNILAFGGFPFLEGSEEWKQKHFLLSLLAQNTLHEYLNLLCLEHDEDDQHSLVTKLMKFLAAPSEKLLGVDIKTKVVSSEPVNHVPVQATKVIKKKKKAKKGVEEKKKKHPRKILMDEATVKRLEADLAREQRILERERKLSEKQINKKTLDTRIGVNIPDKGLEKKASTSSKQSDADLLNALLQTVYKRRALKKAGAKVSAPNKGPLTRLGELTNVKFLVVTANYNDLDVLHHLLYMTEANKTKVRKNILDFAGFNFDEDSFGYKDRMAFLNSLGYDISKRIAFLLGLCPFKADIAQQDLNELIMYFLMSPCKTKQVPIRHYPQTFFSKDVPKEICLLMQKHSDDASFMPINSTRNEQDSSQINQPEVCVAKEIIEAPFSQKAKKSFKSSSLSKPKKNSSAKSISTQQVLSPTPSTSTYFKTTQPLVLPGVSDKIFLPALNQSPRPSLQNAILKSPVLPPACTLPQEYVFQQPTPDGQQKRYKLIKLPPGHPLSSAIKNPQQSSPVMPLQVQSNPISISSPLAINSPIISGQLPPGLILYKNPVVSASPTMSNIVQTVPLVINQPAIKVNPPAVVPSTSREEIILPDIGKSVIPATYEGEGNIEKMHPVAEYPPTDEELFNSIQEVVHSSNFENMTLKNVIDQVTAQYSNFDMSHRHIFMKECVKKIIMGT